jgi:predicted amidohydrolase
MIMQRTTLLLILALTDAAALAEGARVAMIQYDADLHFGASQLNVERLTELAEQAAQGGAAMIVLPEGSTHGYATADEAWCTPERRTCGQWACRDVRQVAESFPEGQSTRHWAAFAREHATYVVYSVIEASAGTYYNSVGVVGPQGFVTSYRKRALYGPDYCYAEEGARPASFATPLGRFGLLICADGNYDSYYQAYRQQGIESVVVPMDWDQDPEGNRAAKVVFQEKAGKNRVGIYVSDNAKWDGSGFYPPDGSARQRDGLPEDGAGSEGVTFK